MRFIVRSTLDAGAALIADEIADLVVADPSMALGIATGSSPLPLYRALRERRARGADFSRMRAFALDEYVGLGADHPESYHSFVRREVTEPLGLDPANVHVPRGDAPDAQAAAREYEGALRAAGGMRLQILGIGTNGHIGFNEPGSARSSRTRVVALTQQSRRDNARFFGGDLDAVPVHALTQGIDTILSAQSVVLLASGRAKAAAIARAVSLPPSPGHPATFLADHPDVTFVVDTDAASETFAPVTRTKAEI